jgi:hemolysin activation/secretion protein
MITSSLVRKTLCTALILVLGIPSVHAQSRPAPPTSGQLLQQSAPPQNAEPSSDTGLTIEHSDSHPHNDSAPFQVDHINVTGATLLPTNDLHALVADGEGKQLTLGQLNELADRITAAYRKHGYPLSNAYVPAQTLSGGTVRIAVLEAHYDNVTLNNRSSTSDSPLRATLTPLANGSVITETTLNRSLLLLGDIPGVGVISTLRPGSAPGTSDLIVDTTDTQRYTGIVSVDDFGNRYTGRTRVSGSFDVNSLLHEGDQLDLSALSSGPDLKYGRLGYRYLLNGQGTILGAAVSGMDYRLSGDLSDVDGHGSAQVASLYVSQPFIRSTQGNLYGQIEFDRRHLNDDIDIIDQRTERHTDAWTATLAGDTRDDHGITNFSLAGTYGLLGFDNDFAQFLDALTARTSGHYVKYSLSVSRLQQLTQNNAIFLGFQGQWANRNLDTAEQFYLGGANNVRGYDIGALAGTQGQMLNLEFRHTFSFSMPGSLIGVAFADTGHLDVYKDPFAPGVNDAHMSDVGLGARWSGPHQWSMSVDVAHPIGSRPALIGPTQSARAWVQIQKGF